jgi:hypothetical protein
MSVTADGLRLPDKRRSIGAALEAAFCANQCQAASLFLKEVVTVLLWSLNQMPRWPDRSKMDLRQLGLHHGNPIPISLPRYKVERLGERRASYTHTAMENLSAAAMRGLRPHPPD